MNPQTNSKSSLNTGRNLAAKYDGHMTRSGEVSAALRTLPDCASVYEEVQHSELSLYSAKKNWDLRANAFSASRDGEVKLRKQLLDMCRAAVTMAESGEIAGLRDILLADSNDEASMAVRISEEIKALPQMGAALSEGLLQRRLELLTRETAHLQVAAALDLATREFGEAFYRASGILAQGKAQLFAAGIVIADKKVPKKKKKKVAAIVPSLGAIAA